MVGVLGLWGMLGLGCVLFGNVVGGMVGVVVFGYGFDCRGGVGVLDGGVCGGG